MRSEGLDAFYTDGQPSKPFLEDAFNAHKDDMKGLIREKIKEAVK